jgi:hypothetical protein
MIVNWLIIKALDADGEMTYRNSFITDMAVNRENVAACGWARWKIENEGFNTLKTKDYHLEHNLGHGQHNLSDHADHTEPAGLSLPHRLRSRWQGVGSGKARTGDLPRILPPPAGTHLLPGVPVLGSSAQSPRLHATAAA